MPRLEDNWKNRSAKMICRTCMFFLPKPATAKPGKTFVLGRCRRNAPTMKGFPAVYDTDWCGDHKIDEEKA